jgi:hypothetical protein
MAGHQAFRTENPSAEPTPSRTADAGDLVVVIIAVSAALLLDLAIFAFLASH